MKYDKFSVIDTKSMHYVHKMVNTFYKTRILYDFALYLGEKRV